MIGDVILIVGNPTHDCLRLSNKRCYFCVGGSICYASRVFNDLLIPYKVISKVGKDFKYFHECDFIPQITHSAQTLSFVNINEKNQRVQFVEGESLPILAQDIHVDMYSAITLICGVFNEIKENTLKLLRDKSTILIGDIQGFIRNTDKNQRVYNRHITSYEYDNIFNLFDYIKVSEDELNFVNINKILTKGVRIIITQGYRGSLVLTNSTIIKVSAFNTKELDSTGAGDSFLAGFVAGLYFKLDEFQALRLGNYFGHIAVNYVGVPPRGEFNNYLGADT